MKVMQSGHQTVHRLAQIWLLCHCTLLTIFLPNRYWRQFADVADFRCL